MADQFVSVPQEENVILVDQKTPEDKPEAMPQAKEDKPEDQPAPLRRQDAFIFNLEEACPNTEIAPEKEATEKTNEPQTSQNVFAIGLEVVVKYKIDKQ